MKKLLAILLLLSVLCTLAACDGTSGSSRRRNDRDDDDGDTSFHIDDSGDDKMTNVSYVLIYNPAIYDENASYNAKCKTGTIASFIDVDACRADGLEEDYPYTPVTPGDLTGGFDFTHVDIEGGRAGGISPIYEENDLHRFYIGMPGTDRRQERMECLYVGKHCYVWGDGSIGKSDAKKFGKTFDDEIYNVDVEQFASPRYADEGGKINIFFYEFAEDGMLGFFTPLDIFATGEVSDYEAEYYMCNLDHAIININAKYLDEFDTLCATLAHEFQHLINSTDMFYAYNLNYTNTWLNEAMSGYIEEYIYPGIQKKDGRYISLHRSDRIRYGQSMYNFDCEYTDIGVYGSVFCFSEYLASKGGSNVFKKYHNYWRESYSFTLCEAETLRASVKSSFANEIDSKFNFDSLRFNSEDEEWMSKLILDFYLCCLKGSSSGVPALKEVSPEKLLYDYMDSAEIEGGGRIVFALNGKTFTVPDDADDGLVYIGLDKNFNPVSIIIK